MSTSIGAPLWGGGTVIIYLVHDHYEYDSGNEDYFYAFSTREAAEKVAKKLGAYREIIELKVDEKD